MTIIAKPLKFIFPLILLLGSILTLNACIVVRTGPAYTSRPVVAPAPAYYYWYYYPNAGVYYNVTEHYYYYPYQGRWYKANQLPQGWVIYSQDRVRLRINGLPYREYANHRRHYPPKRRIRHDHDRYRHDERHERGERHEDYRDRDAPRYSEHRRTEERQYDGGRHEERTETGATFKSPFVPPKGQGGTTGTIRDRGEKGRATPRPDGSTASRHPEQHNNRSEHHDNNGSNPRDATPARGSHRSTTHGNTPPSTNVRKGKDHKKSSADKKHPKKDNKKKKNHKKGKGKSDTSESQSNEGNKEGNKEDESTGSGDNTSRGRFRTR